MCRETYCRRQARKDSPYCSECLTRITLAPFRGTSEYVPAVRRIAEELGMTGRAPRVAVVLPPTATPDSRIPSRAVRESGTE